MIDRPARADLVDLFRTPPPARALRWVESCLGRGARVERAAHIAGGISASVHAVDARSPGGALLRLVLKRFLWDDPSEPGMAHREARILRLVAAAAVPTPALIGLDRHGAQAGVPSLLMTRLPGRPVRRPRDPHRWIAGLARLLPRIHALHVGGAALDVYRPYDVDTPAAPPAGTRRPRLWERAIEVFKGPPPEPPSCFIHRDYHPGNVLWRGGAVTAVVDWPHGCAGAPGADLGHCRANLWALSGRRAADRLLDDYRRVQPAAPPYHPYWDLAAALGGLPDIVPGGEPTPPHARARLKGLGAGAGARLGRRDPRTVRAWWHARSRSPSSTWRRSRPAQPRPRRSATRSTSPASPTGSGTTATGSPSTTACPASPAPRRRC